MSNDISDPEERAGYKTIIYPYQGNGGFTRAINEAIKSHKHPTGNKFDGTPNEGHEITILRVFQGWHGTTIVYREGDGKP